MQRRALAPIDHATWLTEHNDRWTSIHPLLKNYICDAASLQFRRFIGIAHDEAFNDTKLLILEAMLPRSESTYRLWASFYTSLRFQQAPWWDPSTSLLVYDCTLDNVAGTFTFYGTGGGGTDNAQRITTEGCELEPPTAPPPTPDTKANMYLDEGQIQTIKAKTSTTYIPIGRPGAITIPGSLKTYVKMARLGWF